MFKDKKTNHLVTDNDVDMLYRRPESLSGWLPWVDFDAASQTFTLEDGYSAAAMFEVAAYLPKRDQSAFWKRFRPIFRRA